MNLPREQRLRLLSAAVALASIVACGGERAPVASTLDVTIGMRYSRYNPASLTVRAGTTVNFTLRNDDPIGHEFILGSEAEQRKHEVGTDKTHDHQPGAASIGPGETDRVTYTFARAGTVIYGCHLPGHYTYGMRGTVKVTG